MIPIVLASQSPRRKMLLEWAEIEFDILSRETDETYPDGMPAEDIAVHIAHNKAKAVRDSQRFKRYEEGAIVIGADTIVVLDNKVIGKPADRSDAIRMLTALSGRKHEVITGVALISGDKEVQFADRTSVWFHELNEKQITYYVDRYEPFDKAGAYAIQEWIGVVGIERIEGDFYNVMGLPVSRVLRAMDSFVNK